MVSLEQVQLLETRVSKAIEYVEKLTVENTALAEEKALLQKKLEANQKRIDELEVHVMRFKEDQGRIEDGIIAALDRLSQFEEAFENSLKDKMAKKSRLSGQAVKTRGEREKASDKTSVDKTATDVSSENSSKEIYFNISDKDMPKETEMTDDALNEDISSEGELDIF